MKTNLLHWLKDRIAVIGIDADRAALQLPRWSAEAAQPKVNNQ